MHQGHRQEDTGCGQQREWGQARRRIYNTFASWFCRKWKMVIQIQRELVQNVTSPRKMKRKRDHMGQHGLRFQEGHEKRSKQNHWRRTQWGLTKVWRHRPREGSFQERAKDTWACLASWWGRGIAHCENRIQVVQVANGGEWFKSLAADFFPRDVHEEAKRDLSMWGIVPGREDRSYYPWLHGKEDPDLGPSWTISPISSI